MKEINVLDKTNVDDIQIIGGDFGRGYVKAFSKVNGKEHKAIFKSIIGDGRNIDLSDYEEPIYIKYENKDLFVGVLAEKESQVQIRNSKDSKTSDTVKTLMAAMLSEIAVKDTVKIMMGVPYKNYRKSVLKEVIDTYKGKTIEVKNNITGATKRVTIADISIFRESDAAAYHVLGGNITQRIEDIWINTSEMDVYVAGGTSLNLTFDEEFKVVDEPQMATAKGLFDIGERRL